MHTAQNMKFSINPIQDGPFRGCLQIGEGPKKKPSLKSVLYIAQR